MFALMPPPEALKYLLSDAATIESAGAKGHKVIMLNDVARAFFEAPARRPICVELPPEAGAGYRQVGHLRMSGGKLPG